MDAQPAEAEQTAGGPENEREGQAEAAVEARAEPELGEEYGDVEPAAELREESEQVLFRVGTRGCGVSDVGELEVEHGAQQAAEEQRREQQAEERALAPDSSHGHPPPGLAELAGRRHASLEASRGRRPKPESRARRSDQQQGADQQETVDADEPGDGVRAEAARDGAQRQSRSERGEDPFGPAAGEQVPERDPEDQETQGQHLPRDQQQGHEQARRLPRVQHPPEREDRRRESQEHTR